MKEGSEIYIVMALRWGEESEHSYLVGWTADLNKAREMADEEWQHRGCGKYSGVVYEVAEGKIKVRNEVYRRGM